MPMSFSFILAWMAWGAILQAFACWIYARHRREGVSYWDTMWYPWPMGDSSLLTETGKRYRRVAVWLLFVWVVPAFLSFLLFPWL